VRAIDLRYLERWNAARHKPALRQMGIDEIHLGKKQKFLTVVSNLESGEPLWFGPGRKKETLDEYFRTQLSARQRRGIEAACVDMWEPYRLSIEEWAPNCRVGTTSSMFCSTPTAPLTKCGGRSFSARAAAGAGW